MIFLFSEKKYVSNLADTIKYQIWPVSPKIGILRQKAADFFLITSSIFTLREIRRDDFRINILNCEKAGLGDEYKYSAPL